MAKDELKKKLDELGKKLEQKKHELERRGIYSKEHQITQAELDERYQKLKAQLDEEVSSLEAAHHHVSNLEKAILNWINAIGPESR